ncbi:MAG: hypothetical protein ACP5HQ_03575 [Thermoprotei archaeon]
MPLDRRALEDAKFYGKPVAIFFTSKNCAQCDQVYRTVSNNQEIKRRFITVELRADDDLPYYIRLTRGVLPSVSVIDHEGNLLGIIESSNADYVIEKLLLTYQRLDKLVRINYSFVPPPRDFEIAEGLDVVNQVLSGLPGDFRVYEFLSWLASTDQEYQLALKAFRPLEKFSEALSRGKPVNLEEYSADWAIAVDLRLSKEFNRLLEFVNEDGSVKRGLGLANSGVLSDQAYVGNALLDAYEATGESAYLETAKKVFKWALENLSYEVGFRDFKPIDIITEKPLIDPLMNSEFALFSARLWLVSGLEEARKAAEKAISASAHSRGLLVLSRLTMAKLKLDYGYLAKECNSMQCEEIRNLECQFKFRGNCYNSLSEFEENIRVF